MINIEVEKTGDKDLYFKKENLILYTQNRIQ